MLKCKICGSDFIPRIGEHYVAKDCGKTGIVTALSSDEPKIYDTFDCPVCGCQIIAQERKRIYVQQNEVATVDDEEEDDE